MQTLIEIGRMGGSISDEEVQALYTVMQSKTSTNDSSTKQTWSNQNLVNVESVTSALQRIKPRVRKRYEPIRESRSTYIDPIAEFKRTWDSVISRGMS